MENKDLISRSKEGSKRITGRELLLQLFCLTLCVVLFTGCGGAPAEPTATPLPMSSVITTSAGQLFITNAYLPAKDMSGDEAAPGYQILLVWFDSADGNAIGDFYGASEGVYIAGDDGSETQKSLGGIAFGVPYLEFVPPTAAQEFTLHWPGNPPVELILSD